MNKSSYCEEKRDQQRGQREEEQNGREEDR